MISKRDAFARQLNILINCYQYDTTGNGPQNRQTLGEYLADALRDINPSVINEYLNK